MVAAFDARLEQVIAKGPEARALYGMRKILKIIEDNVKPDGELIKFLADLFGQITTKRNKIPIMIKIKPKNKMINFSK